MLFKNLHKLRMKALKTQDDKLYRNVRWKEEINNLILHILFGSKIILIGFILPAVLFYLLKWDLIIGNSEDDNFIPVGYYITYILYWTALYFTYEYRTSRNERASQLAILLSEDINANEREEKRLLFINDYKYMQKF